MALSVMRCMSVVTVLMPFLVHGMHAADVPASQRIDVQPATSAAGVGKRNKHPYTSPKNLFIQERASKQLPGPGQHFAFGALKPWQEIHEKYVTGGRKLLLVVRHGQAVSNYLGDTLGPDEWFQLEETCSYTDPDNHTWGIFDADLTDLGADQAKALNLALDEAGWFGNLTANKPTFGVVSPLSRCLETASTVLHGLKLERVKVEEYVRETLGEDTCDARRSVSDPEPEPTASGGDASDEEASSEGGAKGSKGGRRLLDGGKEHGKGGKHNKQQDGEMEGQEGEGEDLGVGQKQQERNDAEEEKDVEDGEGEEGVEGVGKKHKHHHHHPHDKPVPPCDFEQGLRSKFPDFEFEVLGKDKTGLGLISDKDTLWIASDREVQKHQVARARDFLDALFAEVEQEVVVVVTHSGFTRSLLLAVGREPYRPVNAELVPVIVEKLDRY